MGGQAGYPRTRSGRPVGGSARVRDGMPAQGLRPQTVPARRPRRLSECDFQKTKGTAVLQTYNACVLTIYHRTDMGAMKRAEPAHRAALGPG